MPDNPARRENLKAVGFDVRRAKKLSNSRHSSLSNKEMPAFISALREWDAIAARVLEFLILTNVRRTPCEGNSTAEPGCPGHAALAASFNPTQFNQTRKCSSERP